VNQSLRLLKGLCYAAIYKIGLLLNLLQMAVYWCCGNQCRYV